MKKLIIAVLALSCASVAQTRTPAISGTPTPGQYAYWVTARRLGGTSVSPGEGGGVASVFGRTGIVVAESGDYSAFYAAQSHNHVKAQITDFPALGDAAAKNTGTAAGTVAAGDHTHAGMSSTIASGTASMGTGPIAANSCATVVTVAATGVATTDVIIFTPNADITGVTGYTPAGTLAIYPYPTANNINFTVCNKDQTNAVTPGAVTLNWRVVR